LRIISGKYKGRAIKIPKGIRPTQSKIRKALFDILGKKIKGSKFLEVFAGSGGIGLEAASLGADCVYFIENTPGCLKILKENLKYILANNFYLLAKDAFRAIKELALSNVKFEIIFLDPPYYKDMVKKSLQVLAQYDILATNGYIVAQHFKKDILPEKIGNLILFRQIKYADTQLSFYKNE